MGLEDRLARLHDAELRHHGEPIVYTSADDIETELTGIYVKREIEVALGDSVVSSVEHRVDVRVADVPGGPMRGATVSIRGAVYDVVNVRGPDDAGVARLELHVPD